MFKSIHRVEFTATNGNTVRLDFNPEGDVKIAVRKDNHNQSVSVLPADIARQFITAVIEQIGV